jgi:hypothetical protein
MNIALIVIGALLLCYALWFVAETIRYLVSRSACTCRRIPTGPTAVADQPLAHSEVTHDHPH